MSKADVEELEFTGERLIPEHNKGAAFYYEHLVRYLFAAQLVKDKTVLDAGSGAGYGTHILAKYGQAKHASGIDISQEAVAYAQKKYALDNITFNQDNVEKLATVSDSSMDVVANFEVIEHLNDQEAFLKQVKRVLKQNGILVVSTPNKYTYPEGNPYHTKELYPEEFIELLQKHFKHVTIYHQGFELAQIIKQEKNERFSMEEDFMKGESTTFTPPVNMKSSEYIIAVCSDVDSPKMNHIAMTSVNIEGFDLSTGMVSLSKQFGDLNNRLAALHSQVVSHDDTNKQLLNKLQTSEDEKIQMLTDLKAAVKGKVEMQKEIEQINNLLQTNSDIKQEIEKIMVANKEMERTIESIKTAKFFKLWQGFNKVKKVITRRHDR